jgi:hypothetical protein
MAMMSARNDAGTEEIADRLSGPARPMAVECRGGDVARYRASGRWRPPTPPTRIDAVDAELAGLDPLFRSDMRGVYDVRERP